MMIELVVSAAAFLPSRSISFSAPPLAPARAPALIAAVCEENTGEYDGQTYSVKVQRASPITGLEDCPPVLCIPPIGVGITRKFYDPLHREWAALGAPSELHTPDLVGNGGSSPKRRKLYDPDYWAGQLLAYAREELKRPCVLVVQGGLLPVALEMWRLGGADAIAGMSFLSPPPLRFFTPDAEAEPGVRGRFSSRATPGRSRQRALWLAAQSPLGGLFFRYLRAGAPPLTGPPHLQRSSRTKRQARWPGAPASASPL